MYDRALSNNAFVVEIPVVYDDIEIYTEVSATPIVVDGVVVGVSFYGDNITDRKLAQINLQEKTEVLNTNALNLSSTLRITSEFIKHKGGKIDYEMITSELQVISGAKYVVINTFEGDYSTTKSVSGLVNFKEMAIKYIGYDIFDRKWNRHAEIDKKLYENKILRMKSLTDLTHFDLKENISHFIEKVFSLGEVVMVAVGGNERIVGNLVFIYDKNHQFKNQELIQMFSYQLGQYIERTNAEVALINKMDEMERFHRLTVNRELKMIELKKEINDLLQQAGKEPKYNIMG
jgi:hypothetical protein